MITQPRFEVAAVGQVQPHVWVVARDMVICLTFSGGVPDELWERFARDVASPEVKAVLGLTFEGVSITSVQRKVISDAIKGKKLAAVLKSTVTRGILTALGWLGLNIKVYPWQHLDEAIGEIAPSSETAAITRKLVEQLLVRSNAPSLASLMEK